MPDILKEPVRAGEHLVSQANGSRSRELVAVTGGDYPPATVLGRITASGKYTQLNPAASDGSEQAAGVLYDQALAASGDVRAVVHVRDAEVNGQILTWPVGITVNEKSAATAQLQAAGIIIRH